MTTSFHLFSFFKALSLSVMWHILSFNLHKKTKFRNLERLELGILNLTSTETPPWSVCSEGSTLTKSYRWLSSCFYSSLPHPHIVLDQISWQPGTSQEPQVLRNDYYRVTCASRDTTCASRDTTWHLAHDRLDPKPIRGTASLPGEL